MYSMDQFCWGNKVRELHFCEAEAMEACVSDKWILLDQWSLVH